MKRLKQVLVGKPKDIRDPNIFHKLSLIAFMAWVGLGADGLSSSAYGPDEAFRALEGHTELAVFLAIATAFTVFVISSSYSRIIAHFPSGGGGYVVATKLLGTGAGVVSGSALLVDYVLTVTVSVASGAAQVFSFLPIEYHGWMLPVEAAAIVLLIVLNLRGVKESISFLVPIFLLFLGCHLVVILGTFIKHAGEIPAVAARVSEHVSDGMSTIGFWGMFLIFARAYSRGAGTYTGIEAVSNGLQIMREPKVPTARRTMLYMAISLAVTAGSILIIYLILGVSPEPGKTLNAVMVERLGFGTWFVILVLVSEAALLFVAAQAGFIDGPRVMATMAVDRWLPHRFASLSDRLTMHYGIVLMGGASMAILFLTKGNIDALVTMYSINVFLTFTLTHLGMVRHTLKERKRLGSWKRSFLLFFVGLVLSFSILVLVVVEKIGEGAWMTVVITSSMIFLCVLIRRHYLTVNKKIRSLSDILTGIPTDVDAAAAAPAVLDPKKATAILLVEKYDGLGIHSLLSILKQFSGFFSQIVFVSVAVVDSGNFKGVEEMENMEAEAQENLEKYRLLAAGLGLRAQTRFAVGTEVVDEAERICVELAKQYPRSTFFAAKLVFQKEKWYQRLLHHETGFAIQRRLQWLGLSMVVLPVRVWNELS